MSRVVRTGFALGVLLAAFGALLGCGQRGPLTLPGSARPIERLDRTKAPSAAGAQSSEAAPAEAPPPSEDEERRKE